MGKLKQKAMRSLIKRANDLAIISVLTYIEGGWALVQKELMLTDEQLNNIIIANKKKGDILANDRSIG